MSRRRIAGLLLLASTFLIASCGGGSSTPSTGGGGQTGNNPPPQPDPNYINLTSDAGDYIGGGQNYSYSNLDAIITVTAADRRLTIRVEGDESWTGEFELPDVYTTLEVGTYTGLTRYPFNDDATGGLSWSGEGRGCNTLTGTLEITSVEYSGTTLTAIDLVFEQYCEGGTTALRGDIHWRADDTSQPPGPDPNPPVGLWEPMPGSTPATGNAVYLESEAGDYIGQGRQYLYTNATAIISVTENGGSLSVSITGDEGWNGNFQAMVSVSQIEAGYYGELQRYPFHNPVRGGLSWSGEGRGCNRLTGWFMVDSVTYDGAALQSIEMRFEQHCEGGDPALNGLIRWDADDQTGAPGPENPPPAGLWEPPTQIVPDTGNYVYLESQLGDWVGGGGNYLYTPLDALITVTTNGTLFHVDVEGDESWTGRFQPMNSLSRVEPGYYGELQRYPFHNPVKGGLSWSGEGRGCNTLTGWFVVDSVTYDGNVLTAIEMRFAQYCEGGNAALHGSIRWDVNDPTEPPGPVVPIPSGLWEPPANLVPDTGTYAYFEGQNGNYLYTLADALIIFQSTGANLYTTIGGDEDWNGEFQAMISLTRLEVGYYPGLQRAPFHNPVTGGLSWSGPGAGCNESGWVAIDSVTYDGVDLASIEMRFGQECANGTITFNGALRWDPDDTTSPPGPLVPVPAGLWEPPVGVIPDTGDYVYLESDQGDYIGQGRNYLYTDEDSSIQMTDVGARATVRVNGSETWSGDFQAMSTLNYLEVGLYDDLQRYPFHNVVKGGLSWSGEGRGCNQLSGWFAVDSVTYDGVDLAALELRFEQHCELGDPALRGSIRWTR